jgi:CPA2 family monovalent cation:H+ antiporter-2
VLNPLGARLAAPLERWAVRHGSSSRRSAGLAEERTSSSLDPSTRAIVVGYGPTGRTVTRLLADNGIAPTVVDLNIDSVRELHAAGVSAIYGDATHAATLVSAGLPHASTMIVSSSEDAEAMIGAARELNPSAHVFARATHLRELPPLRRAGADDVFAGEGEVALAMTEAVLKRLGATPDQIDRQRARVRDELFGGIDV